MDEKKEFKKKELNANDYKKDEKIVGGVRKGLGIAAMIGSVIGAIFLKGKNDNTKND